MDNGTPDHTDTVKGVDTVTKSDAFGITSFQVSRRPRLYPMSLEGVIRGVIALGIRGGWLSGLPS